VKTIKVEAIYENEVEYNGCANDKCKKSEKRGCDCNKGYIKRKFTSYKALGDDGEYYRLQGKGADKVREGDEITGIVTEEKWESEDKSGINYYFKFPSKEDLLEEENKKLKEMLAQKESKKEEESEEVDLSDIPF